MSNQYQKENLIDRITERIIEPFDPHNDCWEFDAPKSVRASKTNYPKMEVNGKLESVHRLVHELFIGPIPEEYVVDHKCSNKMCVRPDHLEAITDHENAGQFHRNKTHCKKGHPYTEKNMYRTRGERRCKICYRESVKRYEARKAGY